MFDFGFSELVVILVVALVVIGPERLPRVARTMGFLFGRMQRYVTQVKVDIQREMNMAEFEKMQSEMNEAARQLERSVGTEARKIQQEAHSVVGEFTAPAAAEQSSSQLELGLPQPKANVDDVAKPH